MTCPWWWSTASEGALHGAIRPWQPSVHCGASAVDYRYDAGGRPDEREYTGGVDPAGLWSYGYDALGRIATVSQDGVVLEDIQRDPLGVPLSVFRDASGAAPGAVGTPAPSVWTYTPPTRFGEVPDRDGSAAEAPWLQDTYTWDGMGRLATSHHEEPS